MALPALYSARAFRSFYWNQPHDQSEKLLWISVSPSLKYFDLPLLKLLNRVIPVQRWEYQQGCDEACTMTESVNLLVDYLKSLDRPIHLAGHGLSGLIAMMAADRVPEAVQSLTVLAVAPQPTLTWQVYYYLQRLSTPCSQVRVLAQFAQSLFAPDVPQSLQTRVRLLEQDLSYAPSPHSLYHVAHHDSLSLKIPLLVINGEFDRVICPHIRDLWSDYLKPDDRQLMIPEGRHFFQDTAAELISEAMLQFCLYKC